MTFSIAGSCYKSNTPYSELEEKSWVNGLQGEYGHKAET